jgi:hypothetical protein
MKLKQTTSANESNSKSVANESRKGKTLPSVKIPPVAQAVWVYVDTENSEPLDLEDLGSGNYLDKTTKSKYILVEKTMNGKVIVKRDEDKNENSKRLNIELDNIEEIEGRKQKEKKQKQNEDNDEEESKEEIIYKIPDEKIKVWKEIEKGLAIKYKKDKNDEACFNWALTGLKNDGVQPSLILDYLNGMSKIGELKNKVSKENRKALIKLAKEMKNAGIQVIQTMEKKNKSSPHKKIIEMIKQAGQIIVKEHQFEIVKDEETNMVIVMQSKLTNGVSWEHWWIEVEGIVLETFPTNDFIQVTPDRQHDKEKNYINTRFPVKSLKKEHVDFFSNK